MNCGKIQKENENNETASKVTQNDSAAFRRRYIKFTIVLINVMILFKHFLYCHRVCIMHIEIDV